jgi:hypothetical protein
MLLGVRKNHKQDWRLARTEGNTSVTVYPSPLHQGRDLSEARVLELAKYSPHAEIEAAQTSFSTERCSAVGEGSTSRVKGIIALDGMGLNSASSTADGNATHGHGDSHMPFGYGGHRRTDEGGCWGQCCE